MLSFNCSSKIVALPQTSALLRTHTSYHSALYLIGSCILALRLNAHIYHQFSAHTLPELLELAPLAVCRQMYYQYDGTPAHFGRDARKHPNRIFSGRRIGRGGQNFWSALFPDLRPRDFFAWNHVKQFCSECLWKQKRLFL